MTVGAEAIRVKSFGFRVSGFGFRVSGFGSQISWISLHSHHTTCTYRVNVATNLLKRATRNLKLACGASRLTSRRFLWREVNGLRTYDSRQFFFHISRVEKTTSVGWFNILLKTRQRRGRLLFRGLRRDTVGWQRCRIHFFEAQMRMPDELPLKPLAAHTLIP